MLILFTTRVTRLGEILLFGLIIQDASNFFIRKYGWLCVILEIRRGFMLIFFYFQIKHRWKHFGIF